MSTRALAPFSTEEVDVCLDTLLACGWLQKIKCQPLVQRKYRLGQRYSEQRHVPLESFARAAHSFGSAVAAAASTGSVLPIGTNIESGEVLRALELCAQACTHSTTTCTPLHDRYMTVT